MHKLSKWATILFYKSSIGVISKKFYCSIVWVCFFLFYGLRAADGKTSHSSDYDWNVAKLWLMHESGTQHFSELVPRKYVVWNNQIAKTPSLVMRTWLTNINFQHIKTVTGQKKTILPWKSCWMTTNPFSGHKILAFCPTPSHLIQMLKGRLASKWVTANLNGPLVRAHPHLMTWISLSGKQDLYPMWN